MASGRAHLALVLARTVASLVRTRRTAPIVPRWKPEDVEDLLARYDAQLSQAEARLDSTAATQPVAVEDTRPLHLVRTRSPPVHRGPHPSRLLPRPRLHPRLPAGCPEPCASAFLNPIQICSTRSGADSSAGGCLHPPLRRQPNRRRPHFRHVARTVSARTVGVDLARASSRPFPSSKASPCANPVGSCSATPVSGDGTAPTGDENYGLLASYADAPEAGESLLCLTWGREAADPASFGMWTGLELWHDSVFTECVISLGEQAVDTSAPGPCRVSWPSPDRP